MIVKNLYKTGNAVVPTPSYEGQPVHAYRLVADKGKILTNGEIIADVIDISIADLDNWTEIEDPDDTEADAEWEEIGRILAGEGDEE
jgi:hypothetical protein